MSTPQQHPQQDPFAEFGGNASQTAPTPANPTPNAAPHGSGSSVGTDPFAEFGGHEAGTDSEEKPKFAPYNAAAFGRYTTPENYEKWASTQPKIGPDSKPGEYEAWTGANTPGGTKETLKTIPVAAAETLAGITGASVAGPLIAASPEMVPLAAKAVEYLSHLDNIVKVAKTLGYTSFGLEQAHDIYKWVSGDDKKKPSPTN